MGFSTRIGGISPPPFQGLNLSASRGDSLANVQANRQLFLNEFGADETHLAQPVQISKAGISIVHAPGKYMNQDALITDKPGVYLSILTADCAPIMVWSREKPVIAAVHSGWQGSELDILGQTLKLLVTTCEVSPDSLSVVIGPGLSQEYFDVGPEFYEIFPEKYIQETASEGQARFDNNQFLKDTALTAGVLEEHVEILPYCSYRDKNLFFSHRRDKGTTGRMMSVIGIKE